MPTLEEQLNFKNQSLFPFMPKEENRIPFVTDEDIRAAQESKAKEMEERVQKALLPDLPQIDQEKLDLYKERAGLVPKAEEAPYTSIGDSFFPNFNPQPPKSDPAADRLKLFRELSGLEEKPAVNISPSVGPSSKPFFPTLTGAPIPDHSLKTSQAAPVAAKPVAREPAVSPAAEDSALANLLKSQESEQSRYADLLNRFKETQERQRMAQLGVGLTQAAERIGSAIAMTKPGDQTPYEQAMKLAGGITDEFKEEVAVAREAEKNDPNSTESRSMRALLKEQGITVPENISAAFIEKQYPQFANILNRREAAKERAEYRRERSEERQFALKTRDQQRDDDFILKGMDKLTSDPTYKTRQKVLRGKALVDEAVRNPTSFGDVAALYTAITALDPDSVVREGEIKLTREGESLGESIQRQFKRIGSNPRLLSDRLLADVKKYVDLIEKQTAETYNLKRDALFEQAENRGIKKERYKAMDPFSLRSQAPSTGAEKVTVEKDGKKFKLPKSQLQRAISQGYKEVQ